MSVPYKSFLIPTILAFLISSFYIVAIPGGIKNDAYEYDSLANSILTGNYSIDGRVSMDREPGYPFFRAIIKVFSQNPYLILWIQALLYALTIFFVGIVSFKIEPKIGSLGAWAAALSYGLAFYPSSHLSETLTAFLLASVGLLLVYSIEKPNLKNIILISFVSGLLLLTRYTYILVPIASLAIIYIFSMRQEIPKKKNVINTLIGFAIVFSMLFPWVLRNYITFKEINVAGRSGGILYARAWRADKSWRSLGDSYISIMLGRGILYTVYPNNQSIWTDQWGDWWRDKETIKKMWGEDPIQMDKKRKQAAFDIIFKDFNNFSKFIVWTGVDELRLLQLPNPVLEALGSPFEGTYGPIAKEKTINKIQLLGLALVHIVQLLWFILLFLSIYLGFKKYGYKFIPGIFFVCILLPHSIADNITRYGTPLQPWLLSAILMTIIFPLFIYLKEKRKSYI